mgnify:CR=1 FL=1
MVGIGNRQGTATAGSSLLLGVEADIRSVVEPPTASLKVFRRMTTIASLARRTGDSWDFRVEAVLFEAIRRKLVGAWRDLRSRGLVTLFFFELPVVTLGVILAQAVADWAANREDMAAMEKARARANLEMGDAAFVAQLWKKLGPCIDSEIDMILRSASSGEPIKPERSGVHVSSPIRSCLCPRRRNCSFVNGTAMMSPIITTGCSD